MSDDLPFLQSLSDSMLWGQVYGSTYAKALRGDRPSHEAFQTASRAAHSALLKKHRLEGRDTQCRCVSPKTGERCRKAWAHDYVDIYDSDHALWGERRLDILEVWDDAGVYWSKTDKSE